MTYWALNAVFLAVVAVVAVLAAVAVRRAHPDARRGLLGVFGLTAGLLLVENGNFPCEVHPLDS